MEWPKRHPRLYAIGGVLVIIGSGLVTIAGVWSLFSPEPLIPFILTKLIPTLPLWSRYLAILFFGLLTAFGVILLVAIFRQTKYGTVLGDVLNITEVYEDNKGECGLIFSNSSDTNLEDCHAKLLDLCFETPQGSLKLINYSRVEDLICDQNVAGFSNGKIPLFRWGEGMVSKNLEIVYQKETQPIGYGVTNVPILVLLNLWADGTQNTYAICKLNDRVGWGYQLSILKIGLQRDNPNLATFQKSKSDTEGIDY